MNIIFTFIIILLIIVFLLMIYLAFLLVDFSKKFKKIDKITTKNLQSFLNNRNYQNTQNTQKPKGCPFCGSNEFYDWIYTFVICSNCRGLVDQTPFGLKAVASDASIRFPEILSWWEDRNNDEIIL